MNRSYHNTRQPENWHPAPEYWVYVPDNHNLNGSTSPPPGYPPVPPPGYPRVQRSLNSTGHNRNGSPSPPPGYPRLQRSLNSTGHAGDHWTLYEERLLRGPNFGLPRLPPPPPLPIVVEPVLIEAYDLYSRARHSMHDSPPVYNHEPHYYQIPTRDESKLSPEEQKKAIHGLRKQLYSPHLSNIVKRIGTAKSTNNEATRNSQHDDDWKRCAVCLEDFDTKQFLMMTPCDHMFHEECIIPWVKSQGKCPVCRAAIVEQNATHLNGTYAGLPVGLRGI